MYNKWYFAFFRLDKCERWQQLLCLWCFVTAIVCPCLFLAIQLYWNFKLFCFYFFPNSAFPNWGCGLSKDAAYTRTFTVVAKCKFLVAKSNGDTIHTHTEVAILKFLRERFTLVRLNMVIRLAIKNSWVCFIISIWINCVFHPQAMMLFFLWNLVANLRLLSFS